MQQPPHPKWTRASSFTRFLDHTQDAPQSAGLLYMNDQLFAETSTWQHTTLTTDRYPCLPVGFEPTISVSQRPQTYALDRAATGTGASLYLCSSNKLCCYADAVTNLNTRRMLCNGTINFMCSQQTITSPPIRSFTSTTHYLNFSANGISNRSACFLFLEQIIYSGKAAIKCSLLPPNVYSSDDR